MARPSEFPPGPRLAYRPGPATRSISGACPGGRLPGNLGRVTPTKQLALGGVVAFAQVEQRQGQLPRPAQLLLARWETQLLFLPCRVAGLQCWRQPTELSPVEGGRRRRTESSSGPESRANPNWTVRLMERTKGECLPLLSPRPRDRAVSARSRSKPSGLYSKPAARRRSSHVVEGPKRPSQ